MGVLPVLNFANELQRLVSKLKLEHTMWTLYKSFLLWAKKKNPPKQQQQKQKKNFIKNFLWIIIAVFKNWISSVWENISTKYKLPSPYCLYHRKTSRGINVDDIQEKPCRFIDFLLKIRSTTKCSPFQCLKLL